MSQTKNDSIGTYLGRCNRQSACNSPGATWYNFGTRKYYCEHCAYLINKANPEEKILKGRNLCVEGEQK